MRPLVDKVSSVVTVNLSLAEYRSFVSRCILNVPAFGNESLRKSWTIEWFNNFKQGRESVEDNQRYSKPSTCITEEDLACN